MSWASCLWNEWSDFVAGPETGASIPPPGSNDLQNAVQDLKNVQSDVQQYAPNLSNQWGYLVQQGNLLVAGQHASITQQTWWSMFRQFMLGVHGLECQEPACVFPGHSCTGGIYWTGALILGGAIALAVVIRKVRK